MKIQCNNKQYPLLNPIHVKSSPNEITGILRNYYYQSDPKLGPGIDANRITPCSYHACTTILSLSRDSILNKQLIIQDMVYYIIEMNI